MKKWFENYWYYYKWPTIIGAVILVCVLIGVHAISGTSGNDLQILLIGEECANTEIDTDKMSEAVSGIISDRNEDGEVHLACRELKMTGETDNDLSMLHHLVADFASAESQIYLAEKEYVHHFTDQEVLRPLEEFVSEEHYKDGYFDAEGTLVAVKVTNGELLQDMSIYVNDDTYLALRVEADENENLNALALFKELTK